MIAWGETPDPEALYRRIILARSPTIATEDAFTVAKLHDRVLEYFLRLDVLRDTSRGIDACRAAENALRVAVGLPEVTQ